MADENYTKKALDNIIKATKQDIQNEYINKQLDKGVYEKDVKKLDDEVAYQKALQELIKSSKSFNDALKYNIQELKKQDALYAQLEKNATQATSGFWQKVANKLSGNSSDNSFEEMYRVRQRFGGLEQMFSGNIVSGLSQTLGSFKSIANIMKGPYFLALSLVTKGLLALDGALAKATQTAVSMTGGINSARLGGLGQRFDNMGFVARTRQNLHEIGMGKEYDNIVGSLIKNYGYGSYQGRQSEFITSLGYAQKGLGSLGISADTANTLMSNLRLIEGKDTIGTYAQLNRLVDRMVGNDKKGIKGMSYLSPEQAMQQTMSLFDQAKALGLNFEWANKAIVKFEEQLKKGTMTLNDFAAINRSLQSGGLSQNAGLGALITEYASRAGINLPENFVNSNALGQGFALTLPSMLSNRNILKAYQGQLSEMVQQIGGSNKYEQAGALQAILQSRGINVSATAALEAIRPDGSVDLEKANIMGSKAFQKKEKEEQEAKDYQQAVKDYYTGSTGYTARMLEMVQAIKDKVVGTQGNNVELQKQAEVLYDGKPNIYHRSMSITLANGEATMVTEA